MKKLNRLPEAELTVMRAVWRLEPPVPTGAIRARLEKERPWNLSALQTLLARLTERGFLAVLLALRPLFEEAAASWGLLLGVAAGRPPPVHPLQPEPAPGSGNGGGGSQGRLPGGHG